LLTHQLYSRLLSRSWHLSLATTATIVPVLVLAARSGHLDLATPPMPTAQTHSKPV